MNSESQKLAKLITVVREGRFEHHSVRLQIAFKLNFFDSKKKDEALFFKYKQVKNGYDQKVHEKFSLNFKGRERPIQVDFPSISF